MTKTQMTGDGSILHAIQVITYKLHEIFYHQERMKNTFDLVEFKMLSKYLGTNPYETMIFIAVYACCYNKGDTVVMSEISGFLGCQPFELLTYSKQLSSLIKKGIVIETRSKYQDLLGVAFAGSSFRISGELSFNILNDEPINTIRKSKEYDNYMFVNEVSDLIDARRMKTINTDDLMSLVISTEDLHELKMVATIKKMLPSIDARVLYYGVCEKYVSGSARADLNEILTWIYDNGRMKMDVCHQFDDNTHPLLELHLVEFAMSGLFVDSTLELTEKGKRIFLQEDANMMLEKAVKEDTRLIYPEKIVEKELFFDGNTENMYRMLINNLKQENFEKLQKRLADNKLMTGVTIMLYGYPGTGKTEMVNQIAKATGRQILPVDISQTKDKYFGESEKIIKGIFRTYRRLCDRSDVKPILLFNEADGVFSKRKDVVSGNCAQTENAIQNIILEEMETLDGILIATTNLIENLDKAFERRFLFKVYFEKPSEMSKMKIWRSKLPRLSEDEALSLARNYDLSGGEIDNIVRKAIMTQIVDETDETSVDKIIEFCENEKFDKTVRNHIGFRA